MFLHSGLAGLWPVIINIRLGKKSGYDPSGSSGRNVSWFLKHESTRKFQLPPGWDASPSQG